MKNLTLVPILVILLVGCQSINHSPEEKGGAIESSIENREYIRPIVHIAPAYPIKEANEKVEGACKVLFDLADGEYGSHPTNIRAVSCENRNFFKQCENALQKWLFRHVSKLDSRESPEGLITTCEFRL
ncbi:hypothetical protein [Pseudoalteromonas rubra]|uniref:hypothetical protein n=1 Tax=Pseudoalteromonas rubra TaxID=43658 RepID=UPI000F77921B|nr:hypothetical protein [Pseudoalteromonas rubra]